MLRPGARCGRGVSDGDGARILAVYFVWAIRYRMRFEPQHPGRTGWINSALPPPSGFVAAAVDLTMMASAEGDGELVTDLAAECPALRKTQVMGIRRLAIANQTGKSSHHA